MLLFELVLFGLAVFKCLQVYSDRRKRGVQTSNILVVLIRDSAIYFGGAMAMVLTNMFVWAVGRVSDPF